MEEKSLIVKPETGLITPAEIIDLATEQANVLMDIVEKQKLYIQIEKKNYLYAEAWETIGAFNRTHAITRSVRPIERDGVLVAYEAQVELVKDGQVIGGAIMSCGLDEFPCRGKEGEAKHKAAKSAAQTWATSKAYRMNFSYVAVLAGFQPTPAEEMIVDNKQGKTKTKKQNTLGICPLHNVSLVPGKGDYAPYCPNKIEGVGKSKGRKVWCKGYCFMDIGWMKESIVAIQSKGIDGWSNAEIVKKIDGRTGMSSKSVTEAVWFLNKDQADAFVGEISDLLAIL